MRALTGGLTPIFPSLALAHGAGLESQRGRLAAGHGT